MTDSRRLSSKRRNHDYPSFGDQRESNQRSQAASYARERRPEKRLAPLSQSDFTSFPEPGIPLRSPAGADWANQASAQPPERNEPDCYSEQVAAVSIPPWTGQAERSYLGQSSASESRRNFAAMPSVNRRSTRRSAAANGLNAHRDRQADGASAQPTSRDSGTVASFPPKRGDHREARRGNRQPAERATQGDLSCQTEVGSKQPQSSSRRRRRAAARPRNRGFMAMLYVARMMIFSIGVGVLAGTVLSAWDPASRAPADASTQVSAVVAHPVAISPPVAAPTLANQPLLPGQELSVLKSAIEALATKYTAGNAALVASAYVLDLDTNSHVDVNGDLPLAAASVIKVPVLVAFLQAVDAGKIRLDELLVMRQDLVAKESGDMQYRPVGSKFSAIETATKMITVSDNTATNLLIDRLGGTAALTAQFKAWGLTNTVLNNLLPNVEGTNLTSAKDMTLLLARISNGELLSARSRDRLLDMMRKTVNNSMLPQGIGHGSTIAHKTGTIAMSLGDVGLVDLPNGRRYAISVLVKRAANDRRAMTLIQQTSRVTYQHLMQPSTVPMASPSGTQQSFRQANTPTNSVAQEPVN